MNQMENKNGSLKKALKGYKLKCGVSMVNFCYL